MGAGETPASGIDRRLSIEGSVRYGATLLFLYGIGAGIPVLIVATTAGGLAARLDENGWRVWIDRATGPALLSLGFYSLWTA